MRTPLRDCILDCPLYIDQKEKTESLDCMPLFLARSPLHLRISRATRKTIESTIAGAGLQCCCRDTGTRAKTGAPCFCALETPCWNAENNGAEAKGT